MDRKTIGAFAFALGGALVAMACSNTKTSPASPTADAGSGDGGDDALEAQRLACAFHAGDLPEATLGTTATKLPLQHLVVLMQENRSFDHYLGHHPMARSGAMDGFPADYVNPDAQNVPHAPARATTTCIPFDPPHDWASMHLAVGGGGNDGFFSAAERITPGSGPMALLYYEPEDIPFYTWLYGTFATSDRFFCSVLGPTAPNRRYLMSATSNGSRDANEPLIGDAPSIFAALRAANVEFRYYNKQEYLGPPVPVDAQRDLPAFFADLASGSLPTITFVNAKFSDSEHPPYDVHDGEQFVHDVVVAFGKSPAWSTSALVVTYDESGGFFDHVPPPAACPPDDRPESAPFNRLGLRVPFVVVSPYARRAFVSHRIHSHTSITRLVELLAGVGALTNRDANSDALLDLFDFASAPAAPPDESTVPAPGPRVCTPRDAGADAPDGD